MRRTNATNGVSKKSKSLLMTIEVSVDKTNSEIHVVVLRLSEKLMMKWLFTAIFK